MAIIRDGNQAVLLVVDVQVGVMKNAWEAISITANIALTVEKAREQNIPVIWIQHSDDGLAYGRQDWLIVPELVAEKGEILIHKQYNSSFEGTSLDDILAQLGVTHIVLIGAATNWCIRATAYGALERGYDLTLVKDAHTTEPLEFENSKTIEAENIIRELNVAMTWLSYPYRVNRAVSVSDEIFSIPDEVE